MIVDGIWTLSWSLSVYYYEMISGELRNCVNSDDFGCVRCDDWMQLNDDDDDDGDGLDRRCHCRCPVPGLHDQYRRFDYPPRHLRVGFDSWLTFCSCGGCWIDTRVAEEAVEVAVVVEEEEAAVAEVLSTPSHSTWTRCIRTRVHYCR